MNIEIPFFPLSKYHNDLEKDYVSSEIRKLFDKGSFILDDSVDLFESEFANFVGSTFSVGVGNGFDALKLAIKLYDFPKNSEILVPTNTFIATPLAVTDCGLNFIPVDVNYNTMNIDLDDLESKITKNSVAMILVHLYGNPVNLDHAKEIADKYNLKVIEDCSQAHGSSFNGKKIGSSDNICCFSLYPTKNLGAAGDAGIITTNSKEQYDKLRSLRNYGSSVKYHHELLGINSRLDSIQAIYLNFKLKSLKKEIERKKVIAKKYYSKLDSEKFILPIIDPLNECSWHLFVIKSRLRDKLSEYLLEKGIQTMIHYPIPCHKQLCYSKLNYQTLTVAEKLSREILSIPMNHYLMDDQIDYIIHNMNKF